MTTTESAPASSLFCDGCGAALGSDGRFCPACGRSIGATPAAPAQRSRWRTVALVVGLVVVGLIVLGWLAGDEDAPAGEPADVRSYRMEVGALTGQIGDRFERAGEAARNLTVPSAQLQFAEQMRAARADLLALAALTPPACLAAEHAVLVEATGPYVRATEVALHALTAAQANDVATVQSDTLVLTDLVRVGTDRLTVAQQQLRATRC